MAGAFIASPELRAYAAAAIGSDDIINESIPSEDIKNGQVKAADIGTDAVGADELKGVTKLLFGQCTLTSGEATAMVGAGAFKIVQCTISGVDSDDSAIASYEVANTCFDAGFVQTNPGEVNVAVRNHCSITQSPRAGTISIIVYDK